MTGDSLRERSEDKTILLKNGGEGDKKCATSRWWDDGKVRKLIDIER
jgi:hypothetical protein